MIDVTISHPFPFQWGFKGVQQVAVYTPTNYFQFFINLN